MTRAPRIAFTALTLTMFVGACGGDEAAETAASAPPAVAPAPEAPVNVDPVAPPGASVQILFPADGETVDGPNLTVRLQANNVPIVPATDTTSGTGHHHLFLNAEMSGQGQVIPTITNEVVHMGTGVSEFTFEGLPSGEHRLIAVVADYRHVPLIPGVVDTVRFTIR